MKSSWGIGVAAFFVAFVALMIGLVTIAMRNGQDLVTPVYYKRGLAHELTLTKRRNAMLLPLPVRVEFDTVTSQVVASFPHGDNSRHIEGKVSWYRPDNGSLDFDKTLVVDSAGVMTMDGSQLADGFWRVAIEWTEEGIDYLSETSVIIRKARQ